MNDYMVVYSTDRHCLCGVLRCTYAKSLQACPTLSYPMDCSPPVSSVHGKNTGVGRHPFPSPGDLLDPGTEPASLTSPALAGQFFTTSTTWEAQVLL